MHCDHTSYNGKKHSVQGRKSLGLKVIFRLARLCSEAEVPNSQESIIRQNFRLLPTVRGMADVC